jgi:ribosome modulation factor
MTTLALPTTEDEGALAFQIGRRAKLYRPYGFAFCPYHQGTTQRINWLRGYQRIFEAVSRS